MGYTPNTVIGEWVNVRKDDDNPEATVREHLGDAIENYDVESVAGDYFNAINAALPQNVALTADFFLGPAYDEDKQWDGYPVDAYGDLDLTAVVDSVDLQEIADRHELWDIDEVAYNLGVSSSGAARKTLSRWGVKARDYRPHPESGRPQARYNAQEVKAARASRPGQGARTDRHQEPNV